MLKFRSLQTEELCRLAVEGFSSWRTRPQQAKLHILVERLTAQDQIFAFCDKIMTLSKIRNTAKNKQMLIEVFDNAVQATIFSCPSKYDQETVFEIDAQYVVEIGELTLRIQSPDIDGYSITTIQIEMADPIETNT